MNSLRQWTLLSVIALIALARVLPHPWNFTPVLAMALFGGATLHSRRWAYGAPLVALFVSDLIVGLYPSLWVTYGCVALVVGLGRRMGPQASAGAIALNTLGGSTLFFIITNFGVWALESLYPKTAIGLQQCYLAAIPFFRTMVVGDLLYSALVFGSWALLSKSIPALRPAH